MKLNIPKILSDKAASFPESSYGVNQVSLVLTDGRKVSEVYLAWGKEIIKIQNKTIQSINDINFDISEIKDVISEIKL